MIPCRPGINPSTIVDEAEAPARMFKTSFDATFTTTRQPGPEVACDGDTMPHIMRQANVISGANVFLSMTQSFVPFTGSTALSEAQT